MKPTPEAILNQTFGKLAMEIGPNLPPGYSQGTVTTMAMLLFMMGQEVNRAADVRAKENAAMRKLFAEAGDAAPALKSKLAAAAATHDADLNVATLDKSNGELKTLLIELQANVEDAKGQGARTIERRILEALRDFATWRQIVVPAF